MKRLPMDTLVNVRGTDIIGRVIDNEGDDYRIVAAEDGRTRISHVKRDRLVRIGNLRYQAVFDELPDDE